VGLNVPGVSVLGAGGATFAQLCTDTELQERLERSAAQRGSAHFGWKDLTALKGDCGEAQPFAWNVPGVGQDAAKKRKGGG
jgi:hypothetical protein